MWSKICLWNLALLIMKNHLPLQFVENVVKVFNVTIMSSCAFPFLKLFSNIVLFELVENFKETYVLPLLNDYSCAIANFNLWMSKGTHDVFDLVINFLRSNQKPKHVILGLFEVVETIGQTLAKNLIKLLDACGLRNKTITYVKG
jgi:hypothetical protein